MDEGFRETTINIIGEWIPIMLEAFTIGTRFAITDKEWEGANTGEQFEGRYYYDPFTSLNHIRTTNDERRRLIPILNDLRIMQMTKHPCPAFIKKNKVSEPIFMPTDFRKTTKRQTTKSSDYQGQNVAAPIKVGKVYDPIDIVRTTIKVTTDDHYSRISQKRPS